jgi:hypothetical protein
MEHKNLTIDLSMFATSLKVIKQNLNDYDFEDFLDLLVEASDKEKFEQFITRIELEHSQGSDLATSIANASYDVLVDPEEK